MDLPAAEDHLRILILVRQVGSRNPTAFNRILDRLQRQQALQVSDSSQRRMILANYVTSVQAESVKFGEFQAHRRVMGVIGVACCNPSTSQSSDSTPNREVSPEHRVAVRRRSSVGMPVCVEDAKSNYEALKAEYSGTIVDSRCVLLGYDEDDCTSLFPVREMCHFPSLEGSDRLESEIKEFLRNIYFVHEQRRLDCAFEKLETPPCPLLPEEEKFRVGTENRASKSYKRKCLGRCRKQQADFTLLTGLPQLALEHYQTAIELLKSANDILWLAGALEGWACAAISLLFDETGDRLERLTGMQRVPTLTPQEMRDAKEARQQNTLGVVFGHQRYRSEEDASRLTANSSLTSEGSSMKRSRIPWGRDKKDSKIEPSEVLERFEQSIELYTKFGFAAFLEYECMMKAVSLFRHQRKYIEMEDFHRTHVGKFLDDSFTRFDHVFKAMICTNSANMYKQIGFLRKHAFFARLGVLFRLHVTDGDARTVNDYRSVYPILYRTLPGYGISESSRDFSIEDGNCGPVQVQIKALHEVYTSASRAQIIDAAIRHLCHLLQVYFDDLEPSMTSRLLGELSSLVRQRGSVHNLSQHLSLDGLGLGTSNILLPPIQLTRFPVVCKAEVRALAPHLAPTITQASTGQSAIFIYCAYEKKSSETITWVVGAHCVVSVFVYNCLETELVVRELCLLGEGIPFEAVPVRLSLPPVNVEDARHNMQRIKLIAVPRAPGRLSISGYSCEVFGLKNVCKLTSKTTLQVEVLPELPLLVLHTSMPRAPISATSETAGAEPAAETTVFSGQMFSHSLTVINSSTKIGISNVRLQIRQPKVSGGPSLIQVTDESLNAGTGSVSSDDTDENNVEISFTLGPGEKRDVEFRIFGVDPTATTDDNNGTAIEEMKTVEIPRASSPDEASDPDAAHERIPYTGRLLTCEFVFTYTADVEGPLGESYSRTARLPLAITIVPAVTVSSWSVLPGDGPFTRYIVVDVSNSTDADAELLFAGTRAMSVLPRETCRVPLLCPCCTEVAGRAFHAAQKKDSQILQRREVERLRRALETHVAKHLDIRWSIPSQRLDGLVPVGALLSSVPLLKQLVLPAISLELSTNGVSYLSQDDISIGIGEVVALKVAVISSLDYDFSGELFLSCYQEVSSREEPLDRMKDIVVLGIRRHPFVVPAYPGSAEIPAPRCEVEFRILFRCEGVHKVKPIVMAREGAPLHSDEIFVSPVSFNVTTKQHHA